MRSGPAAGTWAISLPLMPFSAADRFNPSTFRPGTDATELIKTAIRGEFIDLPGSDLTALSGRTFEFPINPHPGYIDATIYLRGAHNPVDITRIEFGMARSQYIDAALHAAFDFTQEGVEIMNRSTILHANLRYEYVN
ncbi:hypothetical protein AB0M46_16905 [Dactylosporangium sp. NPDC051485]|uniref:hypothetical protein n=1 Tax=Dactylosporangium sp. NPDC051485 TaxID=3154846 RepID=UPI00344A6207